MIDPTPPAPETKTTRYSQNAFTIMYLHNTDKGMFLKTINYIYVI